MYPVTGPGKNYASGEWVTSETSEATEVTNPANPSEVVTAYQYLNENDAAAAADAAVAAEDEW